MDNDRELLQLAAKAAGIVGEKWITPSNAAPYMSVPYTPEESAAMHGIDGYCWNPLTDQGDRYRLARTCKLVVDFEEGCVIVRNPEPFPPIIQFEFTPGNDEEEAYAITRAAAAIGRAKGDI